MPKFFELVLYSLPAIFTALSVALYAQSIVADIGQNSFSFIDASFGVCAAFASLSFGWAKLIEDLELRQQILLAGERFFHATILLIMTTLKKYAILTILPESQETWQTMLQTGLGIFVVLLFAAAAVFMYMGLSTINSILVKRLSANSAEI